ncbi:MAG: histidine triad nucleotide-binding protein [Syntrophobacterales bacterium]|jgi:histidine triad (HIT) family protein|nr:histidine triad nucleotide-binding protein [Syntrophobacterales bacterium]
MEGCIFCKIVKGEIPSKKVYENDEVLAFDDIHPAAPVHVVIVPKRHIPTLLDVKRGQDAILGELLLAANEIAEIKGVAEKGFRVAINCNKEGGQVIFHLHVHVLGGRQLADELG